MARQDGVPCIGTKFHIIYGYIYYLKVEGKWAKARLIIKKWLQRVVLGEPLDYKEFKSDWGLLYYVFDVYRGCRPFMKVMHLILDSWYSHRYSEGWKQDRDGIDIDLSEDNLGGDTEEALGQITGTPIKVFATEKGDPKTVREVQPRFYYLQVLEKLTRDNDPILQPVRPTQIFLARYGLEDAYKGGFVSGISMPKEGSYGMEYDPGRVHAIYGFWCE